MALIKLNRTLRKAVIIIGNMVLEILLLYTFFWRMVIYSDIPPKVAREDMVTMGNLILVCILIFNLNMLFMLLTKNKDDSKLHSKRPPLGCPSADKPSLNS